MYFNNSNVCTYAIVVTRVNGTNANIGIILVLTCAGQLWYGNWNEVEKSHILATNQYVIHHDNFDIHVYVSEVTKLNVTSANIVCCCKKI